MSFALTEFPVSSYTWYQEYKWEAKLLLSLLPDWGWGKKNIDQNPEESQLCASIRFT